MTQPRLLAILAATLVAMLAPAHPCRAQLGLPGELVTSSDLSAAQKQQIAQFIDAHKAGLAGGEPAAVRRDRNALLEPLRAPAVSVSFRLEYARQLVPILRPLIGAEKDIVAVNALGLAGELATGSSLDVAAPALSDKRPGVRFAAANAYDRAFVAVTRTDSALASAQAQTAVRTLREGLQKESDACVLQAYVLALASGSHVFSDRIRGGTVRADSLVALSQGIGTKAQEAKPAGEAPARKPQAELDDVFRRAAHAARDAFTDVPLKEPSLEPSVLREIGALGGDILAYVRRRIDANNVPPGADGATSRKRAEVAIMVADAERAIAFTTSALGQQAEEYGLAALLEKGKDAEFQQSVLRVIGPNGILTGAKYAFPDDRFVKPK